MEKYDEAMELLLKIVSQVSKESPYNIPVGVSNRHIHLSQEDVDVLFGKGYALTKLKELSQPGQYACKETVTIGGPKGAIEKVRILGPTRNKTQVEILSGDSFKLGVKAETKMSGDLVGTPGITLIGPMGSVMIKEGVIAAQRHIHMSNKDAENLGVKDGQVVSIEIEGLRGGIYHNTVVRANDNSQLECHIDIEEANAMQIGNKSKIKIIK